MNIQDLGPAHQALVRSTPFRYRVGIEFTTIPPLLYDGRDYLPWEMEQELVIRLSPARGRYKLPHNDPGCMEIASSILTCWTGVLNFTVQCLAAAKQCGCVQESPHSTGGGGHINLSERSWSGDYFDPCTKAIEVGNRIQAWLTRNPWVTWAFNDPSDNTQARLGYGGMEDRVASSPRLDRVEFRFFDAAETLEEQVEHVAFAIRLFELGLRLDTPYVSRASQLLRIRKPTLLNALEGWKQTIREFNLPWNLYHRYSQKIRERYQLGPRYLI